MINIVSLSGGKDSVALWLWARRNGLNPVATYVDTGFEWKGHHAHLDLLEKRIGPIHRIAPAETLLEAARRKGTFPSRVRKWCTEELKLIPFRDWLTEFRKANGWEEVQLLLGVRREESKERALMPEREWSDFYDCEVWRPIIDWTLAQVITEHRKHAIPMHPLYHHGAERVGCFPCVQGSKAELAVVARLMPERVDEIRKTEADIGQTMFTRDRRAEKKREGGEGPSVVPIGIDEVMQWAQTKRGGKEIELVRPPSGCVRWGLCEVPQLGLALEAL